MWDLIYPSRCVHCQDSVYRKKAFTSSFVPFFCTACQPLIYSQGHVHTHSRALFFHNGVLVSSLFDRESPLYSLYKSVQGRSDQGRRLLASLIVLCLQDRWFEKGVHHGLVMPSKKAYLRTKKAPFFTLYQTLSSFVPTLTPIYATWSSELRQKALWRYQTQVIPAAKVAIFIEHYSPQERERVIQLIAWLKKTHGKHTLISVKALFS